MRLAEMQQPVVAMETASASAVALRRRGLQAPQDKQAALITRPVIPEMFPHRARSRNVRNLKDLDISGFLNG